MAYHALGSSPWMTFLNMEAKKLGGGGKGNTLKSSNEITPNIALGLGSELRKTHSVV